ncbi:hypothetical protein [Pectobacterium brasiliense]|uniref:hypothetical protein n=1 Tax=Pectobacterium brasiliense TaxID=180957 RepID=UPI00103DD33C|nr:hypothetical protein [Pectobacterium brasiliense]
MKKDENDYKNKDIKMKENKVNVATVRYTDSQKKALDKLIAEGKVKNVASAIQYLINLYAIKGE